MTPDQSMEPADQQATKKVVLGCMKLLFDKSTHELLVRGLRKDAPAAQNLAMETVGVMKLFADRVTNGQIPRRVLLPAAAMLILEVAKFAAKAGLLKATGNDIKQAGNLLPPLLMKAFPVGASQGAAPAAAQPPAAPPAAPQAGMMGST